MRKLMAAMATVVLLTASCGSKEASLGEDMERVPPTALADSFWRLTELNGTPVENTSGGRPYGIQFDAAEGRFGAFAGCNSMGGGYSIKEQTGEIEFSQIFSTMMACPDMSLETEMIRVLDTSTAFQLNEGTLLLLGGAGVPMARFAQEPGQIAN